MSVQTFIAGGGPYYRLTGAAPTAPGQALLSSADGVARWGASSQGPSFTSVRATMVAWAGVFQLGAIGDVTISEAVSPGTLDGAAVDLVRVVFEGTSLGQATPPTTDNIRVYYLPAGRRVLGSSTVAGACVLIEFTQGGVPQQAVQPFEIEGEQLPYLKIQRTPATGGTGYQTAIRGFSFFYLAEPQGV